MLLLIVTLTLYFNGNEITTHLIHNEIYNKSKKSIFLRGNIYTYTRRQGSVLSRSSTLFRSH